MTSFRIFLVLTLLLLIGCTAPLTNIKSYKDDYYSNQANNSKNVNELKRFLSENNISIASGGVVDNKPQGALSNVIDNGQSFNFTTTNYSTWLYKNVKWVMYHALEPFLYSEVQVKSYFHEKIMVLSICGDYTHASVSQNIQSLTVPFKYMLSQMTFLQREENQIPKWWDCSGTGWGEVIYQKDITVSASLDSIKIGYELINVSGVLSSEDKMFALAKDVMDKANIILLDDTELLQAWKNYQLTKSTSNKPITTKQNTLVPDQTTPLHLEEFKAQCQELGFKVGTSDFGNCVLQLNAAKQ